MFVLVLSGVAFVCPAGCIAVSDRVMVQDYY